MFNSKLLDMYFILYSSRCIVEPSAAFFFGLLQQCHRNNAAHNITGLLFFRNGQFLQLIEGEKQEVDALYQIISRDNRHEQVQILEEGNQEGRNFPDWAMGFKGSFPPSENELPPHIDLNKNQLIFEPDRYNPHPALKHLKAFYSLI